MKMIYERLIKFCLGVSGMYKAIRSLQVQTSTQRSVSLYESSGFHMFTLVSFPHPDLPTLGTS
jgi:hypothetical protein